MADGARVTELLRDRIVGALHVGRIRAGDRLPGFREVAREMGVNERTVAKAYRALAAEGLVEVRERSGVYAARQDNWGGRLPAETGRWLGGILLEAWKRHIPIPDLPELIRRCTAEVALRAVCIDGTEDERRAICGELETAFGIRCTSVSARRMPLKPRDASALPAEVRHADILVATPMFAGATRAAADLLSKPLVIITLHPDLVTAIERRLSDDMLTVVCVDPAFGDQLRSIRGGEAPDRIRVVLADDAAAIAELDPDGPVLLTRAAKERLGEPKFTPLVPLAPFIAPESARDIAELMIRLHMEAEHTRG